MPIKVSIIIPCYNVEEYLRECLDSVLSQSLGEIEVICIDDGSTDSTSTILNSYKEKDSRVVLLKQENSGPSIARNAALSIARGEYISFVDSDDYLAPGALEKCYSLASGHGADLVCFNAETVFDSPEFKAQFQQYEEKIQRNFEKNSYKRFGYEKYNMVDGPSMFSVMYPAGDYRTTIWLCFFKKTLIDKYNFCFIEGILHADDDFTFKTMMCAESVVFSDDVMYYRRFRPDSIMTTPIGRFNAISRIIGQKHMQAFLEKIAPAISAETFGIARQYLSSRRSRINRFYHKYLSEDEDDLIYHSVLAALNEDNYSGMMDPLFSAIELFIEQSKNAQKSGSRHPMRPILDAYLKKTAQYKAKLVEIADRERELQELRENIDQLMSSETWKIGKLILYIPRKLRSIFRRESG